MYGWNSKYLTRDGAPFTPTMGEFHYHRYPAGGWEKELRKMKAGGIDIVSTYVFWYVHEPEEGKFDFNGQRSLRGFLEACKAVGLRAFVRLGPWCHGEARLGGMPAWMHKKGFTPRTNDEGYFAYVDRLYRRIYEECRSLEDKDGGPVIGYQLENEYGHCGGSGGNDHIDRLYDIARAAGFDAPYYTATGWGGAFIGSHCLPVMGGYADAPWDPQLTKLPPNSNFVFSPVRNDASIASDFGTELGLTFDKEKYPFITCEMGGGLQPTFNRRPVCSGDDAAAMAMVKLGSGANLLGYYMYHGGTNPGYDMQESRKAGDYCELPELSYDFMAPLGEYGTVNPQYRTLRLWGLFMRDFGGLLAPAEPVFPEGAARRPDDLTSPNWCYRIKDGSGFVFVNNHQRLYGRAPQRFTPDIPGVSFPGITLENGQYAIYPFNMPVPGGRIVSAKATPLCLLNGKTTVLWADGDPCCVTEGSPDIVILTREEALNASKLTFDGKDCLVIAPVPVWEENGRIAYEAEKPFTARILGDFPREGFREAANGLYEAVFDAPVPATLRVEQVSENPLLREYRIRVTDYPASAESFLTIPYRGCMAELYVNGKKAADDYCTGRGWTVSLARLRDPGELTLRVFALLESMPVYTEFEKSFKNGSLLETGAVGTYAVRYIR